MMHCYIIEQNGKLTISSGDGQAIFLGKWTKNGEAIDTRSRWFMRPCRRSVLAIIRAPSNDDWLRSPFGGLRFGDSTFVIAKNLEASKYEELIAPERSKLKPELASELMRRMTAL